MTAHCIWRKYNTWSNLNISPRAASQSSFGSRLFFFFLASAWISLVFCFKTLSPTSTAKYIVNVVSCNFLPLLFRTKLGMVFTFVLPNSIGDFPFHSDVSYQKLMFSRARGQWTFYQSYPVEPFEMAMKECHVHDQMATTGSILTEQSSRYFVQA